MPRKNRPIDEEKRRLLRELPGRAAAVFRIGELCLVVGERTLGLLTGLAIMVMVERSRGQSGLGVYSYLFAVYTLTAYLAEWGIPHYVERETARRSGFVRIQTDAFENAFQALLGLGLLAAILLVGSAAFDSGFTRIDEKVGAYMFIGIAVLLRNLNRLRLASLNGSGRHSEAATLQALKRIVVFAATYALLVLNVQASYLVISFLIGEIYFMRSCRKKVKLPPLRSAWVARERFQATLKEGGRFLFTDDSMEVVLYLDLLLLGFFMTAGDLGVYAEASILAKFFLLIPMSVRPMLRRKYCVIVGCDESPTAYDLAQKAASRIFALHSLLMLFVLLFYPSILRFLFWTKGEELLSFRIFEAFAPGLLFSASAIAFEPLYEAVGRVGALKSVVMTVLAANIILNVGLIPVAGLFGAALATMLSMLLHFLLAGMCLERPYRPDTSVYIMGGAAVVVAYNVLEWLDAGTALSLFILPVLLGSLFYAIGFFNGAAVAAKPDNGG